MAKKASDDAQPDVATMQQLLPATRSPPRSYEKDIDPSQSVFRAVATRDHGRSPARTEISTSDEKSILKEFGTVETRMPGLGRC